MFEGWIFGKAYSIPYLTQPRSSQVTITLGDTEHWWEVGGLQASPAHIKERGVEREILGGRWVLGTQGRGSELPKNCLGQEDTALANAVSLACLASKGASLNINLEHCHNLPHNHHHHTSMLLVNGRGKN